MDYDNFAKGRILLRLLEYDKYIRMIVHVNKNLKLSSDMQITDRMGWVRAVEICMTHKMMLPERCEMTKELPDCANWRFYLINWLLQQISAF